MVKQKKTVEELFEEALVPKDEQPYKVPKNWVWTNLKSLFEINMGQSPKGEFTTDDSSYTPLIGGPADMGKDFPKVSRYTKKATKLSSEDDLIISIRATIGKTNIADGQYCLGRGVAGIKSGKIETKLLRFYIETIQSYLSKISTGTTFKQISKKNIEDISFPLPPLSEQKRIVEKIERLLSKIDEAKQLIEEAKDSFEPRRNAILDKAFRGEFNGQEIDLKELDGMNYFIPSNWNWMSLEDVCELISDCPHSTPKYIEDGQYPAIRTSDVHFGKIDISKARRVSEKDYLERTRNTQPQKGDIIYCREGTIGNAGIIEDEIVCLAQRVVLFRPNKVKALPKYFVYLLNSPIMLRQVFSNISQTTSPRINISTLRKLRLPIAPIEIQQNIVNIIEKNLEIEQRANNLCKLEGNLDALRQSILSKAFQGELGTNNPSEESSVELLKEVLQEQVQ
ncbi:restriction endonuclease subunit S [Peribacillus frigoritolerans]|uniref:restriction endonuclease subunit S n=1 Tax=Peribacillus frigoritolerans TaxID=450367 RepID=UPI0033062628